MKGTLTIIKGGPNGPGALLTMEDSMPQAEFHQIKEAFEEWWNRQGAYLMLANTSLSVVSIDLSAGGEVVVLKQP